MRKDEQVKNLKVYAELNNSKSYNEFTDIRDKLDDLSKLLQDSIVTFVRLEDYNQEISKFAFKRELEMCKEDVTQCAKAFTVTKLGKELE